MLGSLAKWLRILGFDTVYVRAATDTELLDSAVAEKRTLLTGDEELWRAAAKRGVDVVLVKGETVTERLASALRGCTAELRVDPDRSRCAICNVPLRRIRRESVKHTVPYSVYEKHRLFWRCQTCERVYWMGTHVARMRETLAQTGDEPPRKESEDM